MFNGPVDFSALCSPAKVSESPTPLDEPSARTNRFPKYMIRLLASTDKTHLMSETHSKEPTQPVELGERIEILSPTDLSAPAFSSDEEEYFSFEV